MPRFQQKIPRHTKTARHRESQETEKSPEVIAKEIEISVLFNEELKIPIMLMDSQLKENAAHRSQQNDS